MAGLRFTELQTRPMAFLDFTSVTLDEFQQLVPPFEAAYQAHLAAWRLDGVCSEYLDMPCMRYTFLSHVPDYAKLWPQTLLSA